VEKWNENEEETTSNGDLIVTNEMAWKLAENSIGETELKRG